MKFSIVLGFFGLSFCFVTAAVNTCDTVFEDVPNEWARMVDSCTLKMREQVQKEIQASMTYLAMGTHFAQDTVNRPGFSEFFFKAASEEREHAIKLLEYLLMRGQLTASDSLNYSNLVRLSEINIVPKWANGVEALEAALKLETSVTESIKGIMDECEEPKTGSDKTNDYHLVDYLTTVYLEEQYHGQRDLAGKISTLKKMNNSHGTLAEFLFDKKLLKGEV